jgi:flagellar motor switch protein FliG
MPKINGFNEALALLKDLAPEDQRRIIADIKKRDPELAQKLNDNLITIDDLIAITPRMMVDLFSRIDLQELGFSLKLATKATRDHVVLQVSSRMRADLEDCMKVMKPLDEVLKSHQKLMAVVNEMIKEGKIVLDLAASKRQV